MSTEVVLRKRMGLLELKALLKSNIMHTDHVFPSWVNEARSECCGWERVMCNATTGHVIELSFHNLRPKPYYYYETWLLNVSLLMPFKDLKGLDLTDSQFGGWLGNEGM
ncbi:receptor like protein 21 [Quercus suber]|uniref:Receptor like protein 21 n=1 Tax=Quercus suber TaxID=58331 RepID=A0AAW0IIV5_QUESU